MNRTFKHVVLGLWAGLTLIGIVVPVVHILVELAMIVGVDIGAWNNPVQVFIFVMVCAVLGAFPWGLWIVLTDARKADLFNSDGEVVAYVLPAMAVFLSLTLLLCTRFQAVYAEFRWLFTPGFLICALLLGYWRWRAVWRFPAQIGVRTALEYGLAARDP